ncbi:hypothetical protein MSAN_01580000 [Mycena sanguinolenta]|uniref:DUF6534 domain-containing protein n=1 Tax=Mycena sanguinolenta TaxID=230812 RepID=A0A8H7CXY6_9AGAR|nr:hypothetical protein MSAN_01580000 [Mycena sanguinolenta]
MSSLPPIPPNVGQRTVWKGWMTRSSHLSFLSLLTYLTTDRPWVGIFTLVSSTPTRQYRIFCLITLLHARTAHPPISSRNLLYASTFSRDLRTDILVHPYSQYPDSRPAIPSTRREPRSSTTAPELFGMLFNYGLMGSLLVQVSEISIKYQTFPKDRMSTKAIVYTLLILEISQMGIMSYFAYTIFGSGYGNLDMFDRSALEWFPVCILGSIIAGIVQLFYCPRLRAFSGSWIAGGIVTFLALVQIGSGIGQGVISKRLVDRSKLTGKPITVTVGAILRLEEGCRTDLAVGLMTLYVSLAELNSRNESYDITMLLKRSQAKSVQMRNTIAKLVRYTGAITALVAIVQHTNPQNNYFETPSWILGKLYSNSLLVLLNTRAVTLGGRDYVNSNDNVRHSKSAG